MNIVYKRQKHGINSFIIRLIGFAALAGSLIFSVYKIGDMQWPNHLSWVCYPIFAFLLAQGFENTSDKLRYFARLVLFALISEIPYNLFVSGNFLYPAAQNGMFTLCLGFLLIFIVDLSYKKFRNLIISFALLYFIGLLAFRFAQFVNLEFYSFGVMFVALFYVCTKTSYPRLLMFVFLMIFAFYLASDYYLMLTLGNMQFTTPHRTMFLFAFIPLWFYNGKRGPNKLWLQIANYSFYPVLLLVMYFVKYIF